MTHLLRLGFADEQPDQLVPSGEYLLTAQLQQT
jgi:hypothetical protein